MLTGGGKNRQFERADKKMVKCNGDEAGKEIELEV
jgi:hypothetical protein